MGDNGTRDIVVIGSSLGGVEALGELARQLPGDLPAALLVVQHTSDTSPALLPRILDRVGPLPAVAAEDGMKLERGRIVVAQPNRHMLVSDGRLGVVYGPRENRARPAIDPLFRSAAVNCRSRVIGVVLTGLLDDGAAGLRAIVSCGGAAVVQTPSDAAFPEMPRTALAVVPEARQVTLAELGGLLSRLVREPAPPPPSVPDLVRIEVQLMERAMASRDWNDVPSIATDFTCPECAGALREIEEGGIVRFRCRVGHAYTQEALMAAKEDAVEDALWVALQTLQERAQMLETMTRDERDRGRDRSASTFQERACEARAHAQRLRELIQRLSA